MPDDAPAAPARHRGDTLLVALASALAGLAAWLAYGAIETPDTPTYLAYAEALRHWPLPSGEALLRSSPSPATIFRTPGLPAVIAALQWLAPTQWPALLVGLQILAQAGVAAASHRAGLALGLGRIASAAAALMPAVGIAMVAEAMVMTDALYGALFTLAALLLLRAGLAGGRPGAVALAGLLLGLATLVREATPYLTLGLLPAAAVAAGPGRRVIGIALAVLPVAAASAALMADNHARSGHAILSTSREIVMVQALLPAMRRGVPVYHGDDAFDRAAREIVVPGGYEAIDAFHARLFAEGFDAPAIAAAASDRYARAWREHPMEMLRAIIVRLPVKMFWIPFMPIEAVAELHLRIGETRPWFARDGDLLQRLAGGSAVAGLLLALLWAERAVGIVVAAAAILAPALLRRGDAGRWPLLGLWFACAGFYGVYAPIHIEQRYLLPIVPLMCLLGLAALQAALARRRAAAAR